MSVTFTSIALVLVVGLSMLKIETAGEIKTEGRTSPRSTNKPKESILLK